MSLMSRIFFCSVLFLPYVVRGTLTRSGTVAVDCGGQQTFTCDVTGITTNSAAGWTIMGLVNINALGSNGVVVANNNPRISTSTGGNVPISTITIADFTMSDNGGTVQCINTDDSSEQGTANITVGAPLCPSTMVAHADADIVTVTWQQPPNSPQVLSTMVTYYPSSASNCTSSTDCATNPCIISELGPSTTYNFITQSNNCGFISGCTGKNSTAETACFSSLCTSEPTSVLPTALAGTIPSAFLIMVNIISVAVTILITRWCCTNVSQKGSSTKEEDACEQVKGPKTYEDIVMTSSPAYGPMK